MSECWKGLGKQKWRAVRTTEMGMGQRRKRGWKPGTESFLLLCQMLQSSSRPVHLPAWRRPKGGARTKPSHHEESLAMPKGTR